MLRIEALRYRNENNQDIIILVEGLYQRDNMIWSIGDIQYKTSRQRQYRYFSNVIENDYEYLKLAFEQRKEYKQRKYIEFIGEEKAKEAIMAAWKSIKPNFENENFKSYKKEE